MRSALSLITLTALLSGCVEPRAVACAEAGDCVDGNLCESGRCVPPAVAPPPDAGPVEAPDAGVSSDAGAQVDAGCDPREAFIDGDGDGAFSPISVCDGSALPSGAVLVAPGELDCDDAHAGRYPSAAEVCDGVDNTCDGVVDPLPVCGCETLAGLDGTTYLRCRWRRSAAEAEAACAAAGYRLAMPKTDAEAAAIQAVINAQTWIGLRDDDADAVFQWLDGEELAGLTAEAGQPSLPGVELCASMRTTGWGDNDCADRKPYVCEPAPPQGSCVDNDGDLRGAGCAAGPDCDDGDDSAWGVRFTWRDVDGDELRSALPVRECVGDSAPAALAPPATFDQLDCDDGLDAVGASPCPGSCLVEPLPAGEALLCLDLTASAADAVDRCGEQGAELAVLVDSGAQHRAKDAALVYGGFAGGTLSFWIGLRSPAIDNVYQWLDGSALVDEDFNAGEPNNPNETCVEMRANGGWHDESCDRVDRRFACVR